MLADELRFNKTDLFRSLSHRFTCKLCTPHERWQHGGDYITVLHQRMFGLSAVQKVGQTEAEQYQGVW